MPHKHFLTLRLHCSLSWLYLKTGKKGMGTLSALMENLEDIVHQLLKPPSDSQLVRAQEKTRRKDSVPLFSNWLSSGTLYFLSQNSNHDHRAMKDRFFQFEPSLGSYLSFFSISVSKPGGLLMRLKKDRKKISHELQYKGLLICFLFPHSLFLPGTSYGS